MFVNVFTTFMHRCDVSRGGLYRLEFESFFGGLVFKNIHFNIQLYLLGITKRIEFIKYIKYNV